MVDPGTVVNVIKQARERRTAPLILELDLTDGLVETAPADPISAILSMRRTNLRDVLDGLRRARSDSRVRALVVKVSGGVGLALVQELREAVQALRDAGLYDAALEIMTPEKSSIGLGASLLQDLHAAHPDCDAVFFCNDDLAQGAVFQCGRLGLAVPQRMAIVGFHDLAGSAWTTPPLSTIATPRYQIGAAAAGLLMRHLAGEAVAERHVDLGFTLVQRETS